MLRVLVFSAAAICGFTPAFADRMFTAEEVMTVVELARSRQCESGCAFGGVRVERIDLPAILRSGDRQGFRVTGQSCGSGGCSSAIIAVGSVDAYYLGDGLSVSAHSASIQPVSEATRISETPLAGDHQLALWQQALAQAQAISVRKRTKPFLAMISNGYSGGAG